MVLKFDLLLSEYCFSAPSRLIPDQLISQHNNKPLIWIRSVKIKKCLHNVESSQDLRRERIVISVLLHLCICHM